MSARAMALVVIAKIIARHGGKTWAEGKIDHGAALYFAPPFGNKGVRS